jgi:hypothetical protein
MARLTKKNDPQKALRRAAESSSAPIVAATINYERWANPLSLARSGPSRFSFADRCVPWLVPYPTEVSISGNNGDLDRSSADL